MNVATLLSGTPLALLPPEASAFDAKPTAPVRMTGDLLSILSENPRAQRRDFLLSIAPKRKLIDRSDSLLAINMLAAHFFVEAEDPDIGPSLP